MIQSLVEKLHAAPLKCCLVTTGAGASAIAALMSVAGCSRTLLDARVPYSTAVVESLLDDTPAHFLSAECGRMLALSAFHSARRLAPKDAVVGIGATAAVQTDRSRHGDDAVFVTCWGSDTVADYKCLMRKDMTRAEQEQVVRNVILKALANAAGVEFDVVPLLDGNTIQETVLPPAGDPLESLLSNRIPCVVFNACGMPRCELPPFVPENYSSSRRVHLVMPGSFNPLHWGHTELANAAAAEAKEKFGKPCTVTYELAIARVGKDHLSEAEIQRRLEQFPRRSRVAVTNAKLFVDKAHIFPNSGFVVGLDTAERLLDPKYYRGDPAFMIESLQNLSTSGSFFIVGGRKDPTTHMWRDLSHLTIPEDIAHMFVNIPESKYRVDISSTELRSARASPTPPITPISPALGSTKL